MKNILNMFIYQIFFLAVVLCNIRKVFSDPECFDVDPTFHADADPEKKFPKIFNYCFQNLTKLIMCNFLSSKVRWERTDEGWGRRDVVCGWDEREVRRGEGWGRKGEGWGRRGKGWGRKGEGAVLRDEGRRMKYEVGELSYEVGVIWSLDSQVKLFLQIFLIMKICVWIWIFSSTIQQHTWKAS